MSKLQNCCQALSCAVAISIVSAVAPAVAADYIKVSSRASKIWKIPRGTLVSIAELERFAQTGKYEDFPEVFRNGIIPTKDVYKQLNNQIPTSLSEDSIEASLLGLLLPQIEKIDKEDQKVMSKLIPKKVKGKNLITFLKTLPVDTITDKNFLSTLQVYRFEKRLPVLERSATPLGVGTPLYSTGETMRVEVLGSGAAFTSDLYLIRSPQHHQHIASNRQAGAVINLDPMPAGQELVFELAVHDTGYRYYTGNSGGNPDGLNHAMVTFSSPGVVRVGFEDQFGGGDLNFADHNFLFSGINTLPQLLKIQSATTVQRREFFDFYASAHDWETPQGLSFVWDFNGDGQIDYEGAEGPTYWNYGKKGVYNSKVRVTDASGSIAEYTFQTTVVPEPSAVASLALLGMVGLGKVAWRKRKGA